MLLLLLLLLLSRIITTSEEAIDKETQSSLERLGSECEVVPFDSPTA
jgi:hypothetical protein